MSEVKKVKLTPHEIRTAKNAARNREDLDPRQQIDACCQPGRSRSQTGTGKPDRSSRHKKKPLQIMLALLMSRPVEKKVLADQEMRAATEAGEKARADAEAARVAKILAAQEAAAAKQLQIEQSKQRAQEAAAAKLAWPKQKRKQPEEAAALKQAQTEARKKAAEEAAAMKKAEAEAKKACRRAGCCRQKSRNGSKRLAAEEAAALKKAEAEARKLAAEQQQLRRRRKLTQKRKPLKKLLH